MKTTIVGGDFGKAKESSVIRKISNFFDNPTIYNGGILDELPVDKIQESSLIIWAPNIENEIQKQYPKKSTGAVLICSKVMRPETTTIEAIARIFKMNGNAVIAIYPPSEQGDKFNFNLIDALGNSWYEGDDIKLLSNSIKNLYNWAVKSIRMGTQKSEFEFNPQSPEYLDKLIELNKIVADKFESVGGRFFGNTSTRCLKMFPTYRYDDVYMMVSRRNVDKSRITKEDFVKVKYSDNKLNYIGDSKPSVDTPIQASIYQQFPNVNVMIHGHTYLEGAPYTTDYYPCGDMRECSEVSKLIQGEFGSINLTHHGFLIYANNLDQLSNIISELVFIPRQIEKLKND